MSTMCNKVAMSESGAFEIFDAAMPFAGARYGAMKARMVVVGLGNEELLVISPGLPLDDAWFARMATWGTPRFLLAPNHFHNAGIAAWAARFPDATVVAHPRAIPRLRKQVKGVTFATLDVLERALPFGMHLLCPPMAKQGEVWLSLLTTAGRAWFVTDSVANERRLPGGPLGLFMRAVGWRTGVIVNPFFKRLFVTDKRAFIAWAREQLAREKPKLFVPAHGGVVSGDDVITEIERALDAA